MLRLEIRGDDPVHNFELRPNHRFHGINALTIFPMRGVVLTKDPLDRERDPKKRVSVFRSNPALNYECRSFDGFGRV